MADITAMDLSAPLHWLKTKWVPHMVQALHSPFDRVADAHPKLFGASLHAPPDHQPIARLKDVQRTWDCRISHCAHKYGNILI